MKIFVEKAVIEQALEALKWSVPMGSTREAKQQYVEAYAALREALAEQAEQEPVACVACGKPTMHIGNKCYSCCQTNKPVAVYDDWLGHPIMVDDAPELTDSQPLYAAPVRTKDLTDDEIHKCDRATVTRQDFARAVIAADREKNK